MTAGGTTVEVTVGDNKTLEQFEKLLEDRIVYLKESARNGIAACAIDFLRSVRATTKQAKVSTVTSDVQVYLNTQLYPSFKTVGKKRVFCLRYNGSKQEYKGAGNVRITDKGAKVSTQHVYNYTLRTKKKIVPYLIVATSEAVALRWAKNFKKKLGMRFSGLAKMALTTLMMKSVTVGKDGTEGNIEVNAKAKEYTKRTETNGTEQNAARYEIQLDDNLNYAVPAVEGGSSGIDLAMKKAMNKITSVINQKCKNLLLFEKLPTPFPSIR